MNRATLHGRKQCYYDLDTITPRAYSGLRGCLLISSKRSLLLARLEGKVQYKTRLPWCIRVTCKTRNRTPGNPIENCDNGRRPLRGQRRKRLAHPEDAYAGMSKRQ